jgi:peptidyl-prolyl cis-trans isomerase A (cyclophilin A)
MATMYYLDCLRSEFTEGMPMRQILLHVMLVASAAMITAANSASPADGVHVSLETTAGTIELEVFPKVAPHSACDFLAYVDSGLYQGAAFYRVVRPDNDHGNPKIEVIQGGLLDESKGRPPVAHETTKVTGLKHTEGTLSLARGPVGTGSAAAFFIVIGDQPALDYGGTRNPDGQGFAAFGRVVKGMEIVHRIQQMSANGKADDVYTQGQILTEPVIIKSAKRPDTVKPPGCTASK